MTGVGSIYGGALYDLAREEGLDRRILKQIVILEDCFSREPEFLRLLSSPVLTKAERCQILDRCFRGRLEPCVLNFLKLLTEKGYLRQFSGCAEAYRRRYRRDRGILSVTAVTAVTMEAEQKTRLAEKLGRISGKHIELTCRIDPTVLGVVRLDFDGKRLDGTVAHQLEMIGSMLRGAEI